MHPDPRRASDARIQDLPSHGITLSAGTWPEANTVVADLFAQSGLCVRTVFRGVLEERHAPAGSVLLGYAHTICGSADCDGVYCALARAWPATDRPEHSNNCSPVRPARASRHASSASAGRSICRSAESPEQSVFDRRCGAKSAVRSSGIASRDRAPTQQVTFRVDQVLRSHRISFAVFSQISAAGAALRVVSLSDQTCLPDRIHLALPRTDAGRARHL